MLIKILIENDAISENFYSEHGLSIYIETQGEKILFDTGASGLFAENAEKMDVNLADVDYVVISHAHYDHVGGLLTFFKHNKNAKVFIHQKAFDGCYCERNGEIRFIGPDNRILEEFGDRIIKTEDDHRISDKIRLFSNKKSAPEFSANRGNQNLLILDRNSKFCRELMPDKNGGNFQNPGALDLFLPDTFLHEQNMIIEENGKVFMLTGCAHCGIINIINSCKKTPDYVIGGFHLYDYFDNEEDKKILDKIAIAMKNCNTEFYTGHCTGDFPYEHLKKTLKERIYRIKTGMKKRF